jgi:hypothetical protein
VKAYQEALKGRTRERVPLEWAMTQSNLGHVFESLGKQEEGTEKLKGTVTIYKAVLEVFEAAQVSYYVKIAEDNLRRAEALLLERQKRCRDKCLLHSSTGYSFHGGKATPKIGQLKVLIWSKMAYNGLGESP